MDLADKIKELREKKGINQADLALSVGVSCATVSGWERKAYNPSCSNIDKLGKVLGEPLIGYRRAVTLKRRKTSSTAKKPVYKANKSVDVGKIGALHRAGWKIDEIARDMRLPEEEVAKHLRRMEKDGEINTSPQQRD